MAELHVVGRTDDDRHLLLARTPGGSGEFRLAANEALSAAQRAPQRAGSASALSPRQIQAELRAGASVEEVAARAGVPVSRLEPYAAPVLSELARVLEDALAARMSRPQHGPSALPLGRAVRARLATADGRGPGPSWAARRNHDASWVVELRHAGAAGPAVARWRWDRTVHSLAPLDSVAAELGHVPAREERPAAAPLENQPAAPAPVPASPTGNEPAAADSGHGVEAQRSTVVADRSKDADAGRLPTEASRPARSGRSARRPAVPAWADVLMGVTAAGPRSPADPPAETEAAG